MSKASRRATRAESDAWRRRLVAGCELALTRLGKQPRHLVADLFRDITALRDRLVGELNESPERSAMPPSEITVRVNARAGGVVAAAELETALASLSYDLNTGILDAIAAALRHAVGATASELALTESQGIALLAQIRHSAAYGAALTPLGVAIDQALHS